VLHAAWSFADIAVTAPRATGSTALDAEQLEGPVGRVAPTPAPAPPVSPPVPAPPTSTASTAPAPTIDSTTVKAAPSGAANTRKTVGVGEAVDLTASAAGTWSASAGTASGPSSTTFRWTAPATAGTVAIRLTSGNQQATETITVVAPTGISMRNVGSHASLVGTGGACMLTEVTLLPTSVCLGAVQWLEVPGPATGIKGFFEKYSASTLHHDPNPNYAVINDSNIMEAGPNNGPNDHCSWHSTAGPYKAGTFRWVIPNRYILDGEAASSGRFFTNTTQQFTMDAAGLMTITKAGAST
jgi:hypothetical protein